MSLILSLCERVCVCQLRCLPWVCNVCEHLILINILMNFIWMCVYVSSFKCFFPPFNFGDICQHDDCLSSTVYAVGFVLILPLRVRKVDICQERHTHKYGDRKTKLTQFNIRFRCWMFQKFIQPKLRKQMVLVYIHSESLRVYKYISNLCFVEW